MPIARSTWSNPLALNRPTERRKEMRPIQIIGLLVFMFPTLLIVGAMIATIFREDRVACVKIAIAMVIMFFGLFIALFCSGCSWQGQKHVEYWTQGKDVVLPANMPLCYKPDAWVKVVTSEWWSMRFLWVSNGIECYTKTPYYTSGASIDQSMTDANSVKAATEGTVRGLGVVK
jgi:hypothetical protein